MKTFEHLHPAVNFIYYISAIVFGVILRHPVFLCITFSAALIYNIVLQGKKALKMLFAFYLPMLIFVVIVNALTTHYGETVLFGNIMLEPVLYGISAAVSTASVFMIFFCYNNTVSSDKLMFVLGGKMPKAALIINMSLRFLPLYAVKLKEIAAAQKGLGKSLDGGNLREKIKNGGDMISVLISIALEGAIETADSMKNRGYGLNGRTHYSVYRFTFTDGVLITVFILCDIAIVAAVIMGEAYVAYNPIFEINKITFFSVIIYFVYFAMLLIPVLLDIKERIKWKILQSKI